MIHALLALGMTLHGASFDCKKASHPVEKKICRDAALSTLDDSLGRTWKRVRETISGAELAVALADQKAWMAAVRNDNPTVDSLRSAWKHRITAWKFRMSVGDLRALAKSRGGFAFTLPGGCPGRWSEENGVEVVPASNTLSMRWDPATDRLRFGVGESIDQHACGGCDAEGEAVLSPTKISGLDVWTGIGRNQDGDTLATAEFHIARDHIVAKVVAKRPGEICGAGAGFSDSLVFPKTTILRQD